MEREAVVARWFLEAVGLGGAVDVDLWDLAKRWGFSVRVRVGSGFIPRTGEVIWLEKGTSQEERRCTLAYELGAIALDISAQRGDPARVGSHFLVPGSVQRSTHSGRRP